MKLHFSGYHLAVTVSSQLTVLKLKQQLEAEHNLQSDHYYLTSNGKILHNDHILNEQPVHIVPRVLGGKGGFGSMLRAIGAQIEKTTNREACRDLSGRRLRDINEEQRLKNWINNQAEREKEAAERKKKKLERLCEKPKHEFKDDAYDKERSALPEMIEDAVLQGLQVSTSSKRKCDDEEKVVKKKKTKLWIDEELEDLSDDDSEEEENKNETTNEDAAVSNIDEEKKNTDTAEKNDENINELVDKKSNDLNKQTDKKT
ncbi:splicing regulator SDE2 [Leptinotarsa decemlineata]|uniref:splicing regulator SDE2 n=1 Tax=Leptinotarsa decemlineata TaxID=7539 RepID=UPI003D30689C